MLEFAAGLMIGGSIGAVIMGALLAQTRESFAVHREPSRRHAAAASAEARGFRLTPRPAPAQLEPGLALLLGTAAAPQRIRGH